MIITLCTLAVWGVLVWLYVWMLKDFLANPEKGLALVLGWFIFVTFAGLIVFSGVAALVASTRLW